MSVSIYTGHNPSSQDDIDGDLRKFGVYVNSEYFPDYQRPPVKPEVMEAIYDEMFVELQQLKVQRKEMVLAIEELQNLVSGFYAKIGSSSHVNFLYQPKVI